MLFRRMGWRRRVEEGHWGHHKLGLIGAHGDGVFVEQCRQGSNGDPEECPWCPKLTGSLLIHEPGRALTATTCILLGPNDACGIGQKSMLARSPNMRIGRSKLFGRIHNICDFRISTRECIVEADDRLSGPVAQGRQPLGQLP